MLLEITSTNAASSSGWNILSTPFARVRLDPALELGEGVVDASSSDRLLTLKMKIFS